MPPGEPQPKEKLEVDLFVCPEEGCRQIGKRPISDVNGKAAAFKGYCVGSAKQRHKKRKMELVRFEEAGE